jgi:hypothetical protein
VTAGSVFLLRIGRVILRPFVFSLFFKHPYGRRVAFFYSKLYGASFDRALRFWMTRPAPCRSPRRVFQQLDAAIVTSVRRPLLLREKLDSTRTQIPVGKEAGV